MAAAITLIGPGSLSADAAIGWPLHGLGWASAAVLIGASSALIVLGTRRGSAHTSAAGQQQTR